METVFQLFETRGKLLALVVLVLLLAWESVTPYFTFFKGRTKARSEHAVRNIAMGMLNGLMIGLLFVIAWLWAAEYAFEHRFGLLYIAELPMWAHAIAAVLLLDVWTYWFHRMSHRISFIWKFHRVHHSDNKMDVTTANRFHFGEIFISSVLRTGIILLVGAQLWHVALYEMIMFPVVQFHHANVGVSDKMDRFLRIFIVTPAMHKVHHSRWQPETDSNYTSLLSIWDRVFGSFRLREDPHEIELGLDHYDTEQSQQLPGMLKTPFKSRPDESADNDSSPS